jgi:hypothetical protein
MGSATGRPAASSRSRSAARRETIGTPPEATEGASMSNHPFLDLAALFARIFVVGMSITAVVLGLILMIVAIVS